MRMRDTLQQRYGVTRPRLAQAMLADLLKILKNISCVQHIAIVSSEPTIDRYINDSNNDNGNDFKTNTTVELLDDHGESLNQSLLGAINTLKQRNIDRCIIVPADIPLATANDLDDAIAQFLNHRRSTSSTSITILPSANRRGTNLLGFNPQKFDFSNHHTDSNFSLRYGDDSYQQHQALANNNGINVLALACNSLSYDIDHIEDIDHLLNHFATRSEPRASATRQLFAAQLQTIEFNHWQRISDNTQLETLCRQAATRRDQYFGQLMTYSPKVFIPLTRLCRDVCHYCTFATVPKSVPAPYLSPDEVLSIARQGEAAGCKEALLTLGEKPELRYTVAKEALADMGFSSTLEYVAHIAQLILDETGLLPHINAGNMTTAELDMLRPVSASMGIMLENISPRLCEKGQPHYGSPDKLPALRLATLERAGHAKVPMTTGILIGIGETRDEIIESLLAIKTLHQQHGHIQEVIVQNFVAKHDTKMADHASANLKELRWAIAMARLILPADISLQAPPNLNHGNLSQLIGAGINDWGGVSPVTLDHVNPEAPWPELTQLAEQTGTAGKHLQQRLTIYPKYALQNQRWIDKGCRSAVLQLMDGQGLARQDQWLSGVSETIPDYLRKQLADHSKPQAANTAPSPITQILDRAVQSQETLTHTDIATLFTARGDDLTAVCQLADQLRQQVNGNTVSYVINRNINYTNICTYSCNFCAFSKGNKHAPGGDKPYLKSIDEIVMLASEARQRGATEVCLQGGIHPHFNGSTYLDICAAVHEAEPSLHIHAFSPLEVWHGAESLNMPLHDFLAQLKANGLGTLPGTAAEILNDNVRDIICPDKLNTEQWLEVMATAHKLGISTTATIMFGHVDHYQHWAEHLLHIRNLQQQTGGFTEFVPLPFVADLAPLYKRGLSRRGATLRESILMHAVARLVLHGAIDNIQASWVKMGLQGAKLCLNAGVNDLGGVLMNESITRAAGAAHGQQIQQSELEHAIKQCKREPVQRTTLYQPVTIQALPPEYGTYSNNTIPLVTIFH